MPPVTPVPCPLCKKPGVRATLRCDGCGSGLAVGEVEVCSGALRGRKAPVFDAPFTIGRAADNDLALPDMAVSRLHARILREGEAFHVEDLDSRFGVYVDGSRVHRSALTSPARVKIGDTLLCFVSKPPVVEPVAPTDPAISSGIPVAGKADLLLAMVEALGSTIVMSEVLERVVDALLRVTRAERGFLLLEDPGPERTAPVVAGLHLRLARQSEASLEATIGISTSIVSRVRTTGLPVVTGNASRDASLSEVDSVISRNLKTVVCLPLRVPRPDGSAEMLGVIYADNQSRSTAFTDESLRTADALARHAALAIHNAQLFEREHRANADLRTARDEALLASRAKSAFLATMSHELHTPLNAIIGYGEMIEERAQDRGDADDKDDARRILTAGRQLLRLVDEVLDMSQLEAGHMRLMCEPVELAALLREQLAMARATGERKGVKVEAEIPDGLRAEAEPRRLCQVFGKIVENALSFTGQGTVHVRARSAADTERWVELEIADEGPGMTEEQAQRVLEPFVQADSSHTRQHGGMGLGLPLSARLCEAMGGELSLASAPGRGTTVTVRLPAAN